MTASGRVLVMVALGALVAVSMPRYLNGVMAGDYGRASQMVALVWAGFFASAEYWVKNEPSFSLSLIVVAAILCAPLLLYHVYDGRRFAPTFGTLVLLAGIGLYTYGAVIRSFRSKP